MNAVMGLDGMIGFWPQRRRRRSAGRCRATSSRSRCISSSRAPLSCLLPTPPASSYCAACQAHNVLILLQTLKYLTTFVPNLAASSKPIASPSCPAPPSLTLKHPTILLTTTLESRHFNYHTCDPEF